MNSKKATSVERFLNNISKTKIRKFCETLDNSQLKLSDGIFKLKIFLLEAQYD